MKIIGHRAFLFLLAIASLSSLFALTTEEETTVKEIVSYLSEHSLSPYFQGGKSEYTHLGFIKDSYNNNTHALGVVQQGDNSCITLFSIQRTWLWNEIKTDLIYLTTDDPISPVLFENVAHLIISSSEKDLTDFHVFIEKQDAHAPQGSKLQKWTFFRGEDHTEAFVVLTDDGHGGTYFKIVPFS